MNMIWQEYLAKRGAHFDQGSVTHFGDMADELRAARQTTIVAPLPHLVPVGFSGDDAQSFLHNQLTSDVNHLGSESAQYSSWCSHKGRMQASFLLFRRNADYRALISADLAENTLTQLRRYVLRSKVKLEDLSTSHVVIGVAGPEAIDALQAAGLPVPDALMSSLEAGGSTVIHVDAQRYVLVAELPVASELFEQLAERARPVGTLAWQWLDIQAGIVFVSAATKEEFVPQMANLDKIGGVSFHKGCYPGQEVVARAKYLGKIKRHLYRIKTDAPVSAGTSLFQAENGELASGIVAAAAPDPDGGYAALAVIKESAADSDDVRLQIPGVTVIGIEPV